jgi:hypothetical protein
MSDSHRRVGPDGLTTIVAPEDTAKWVGSEDDHYVVRYQRRK